MEIEAYCLDWHIKKSGAFTDLLVEPLTPYGKITLRSWDSANMPKSFRFDKPNIFCMLPPPEYILKRNDLKIIWIPMWDQAQEYTQAWWDNLPSNMRVVAFSKNIAIKSRAAGLHTLHLKYYKKTDTDKKVSWDNGRILFYWNRVGMVGPTFLEKICDSLKIDQLLFKGILDPRIEKNKYFELPDYIGNTRVINIGSYKNREEFYSTIKYANIVLSPRLSEGVGMVFLEAMSRGCAVIAHDAPTMNEYIANGNNGILLTNNYLPLKTKIYKVVGRKLRPSPPSSPYLLSDNQPWSKISNIKLETIGKRALNDNEAGFNSWEDNLKEYSDFIFKW